MKYFLENEYDPDNEIYVPYDTSLQHFKYQETYTYIIESVFDTTLGYSAYAGTTIINYGDSAMNYPEFFGRVHNGEFFTKNVEDADPDHYGGNYHPYLRKSSVYEDLSLGGTQGHSVGMSQIGALSLSEAGFDYDEILLNYYHSSPPIAEYIKVVRGGQITGSSISGGSVVYQGTWTEVINGENISRILNPINSYTNNSQNLQFELHFSERVGEVGANGTVKLTSNTNNNGKYVTRSSRTDTKNPPNTWIGEISVADIASLGEGIIIININDNNYVWHKEVTAAGLDIDPTDVALYIIETNNYQVGTDTNHQITIDTTSPQLGSPSPLARASVPATVNFTGTVTDAGSGVKPDTVKIKVDGVEHSLDSYNTATGAYSYTYTFSSSGAHNYQVLADDNVGNHFASGMFNVSVDNADPQITNLDFFVDTNARQLIVTLTVTATDLDELKLTAEGVTYSSKDNPSKWSETSPTNWRAEVPIAIPGRDNNEAYRVAKVECLDKAANVDTREFTYKVVPALADYPDISPTNSLYAVVIEKAYQAQFPAGFWQSRFGIADDYMIENKTLKQLMIEAAVTLSEGDSRKSHSYNPYVLTTDSRTRTGNAYLKAKTEMDLAQDEQVEYLKTGDDQHLKAFVQHLGRMQHYLIETSIPAHTRNNPYEK